MIYCINIINVSVADVISIDTKRCNNREFSNQQTLGK